MSLFKTPGTGKGFYRPYPGQYIGEFVGVSEGPPSKFTNADGTAKGTVRWGWMLYTQDGQPVMNEGSQAEGDGLTSESTGPDSTAAEWFKAHGRPLSIGDDMDKAVEEITGKKVLLLYAPSGDKDDSGKEYGRLRVVMPYNG